MNCNNDCLNCQFSDCINGYHDSERNKAYYQKNREKILDAIKQRRKEDPERFREYVRRWQRNHREELRERARTYYQKNREKILEKTRERRARMKSEKEREYAKTYYQKNRERILQKARERRARMKVEKEHGAEKK